MKLSSSTGDFSFYAPTVPEKASCFRETKFRYINNAISIKREHFGIPDLFSLFVMRYHATKWSNAYSTVMTVPMKKGILASQSMSR